MNEELQGPPPPLPEEKLFPLQPALTNKDRITCSFSFNYEHLGEQPTTIHAIAHAYPQPLEQPYERRLVAKEEWQPLDFGWFAPDQIGYLILTNNEGKGRQVQPTDTERADCEKRVVEISCEVPTGDNSRFPLKILVFPGWPQLIRVSNPAQLQIRCQHESAKCHLYVFPK